MSSELNKSHPFRKTISNKSNKKAEPSASVEATVPPPEAELPSTAGMSLLDRANAEVANAKRNSKKSKEPTLGQRAADSKKKAKLLGGALLATMLYYGSIEVYDLLFNGPSTPDARSRAMRATDTDFGTRDVEEARAAGGFFSNLFCRGGRKAAFCD